MKRLIARLHKNAWLIGAVLIVVVVFGTDWTLAQSRLDNIVIDVHVEPESVIANGRDSTTLTIRITEDGQPRANDLIQIWLSKGGGLVVPNWVYTDEDGTLIATYTPNPYSRYDPQDGAEIHIRNTSIGRLIEVAKEATVSVTLLQPESNS